MKSNSQKLRDLLLAKSTSMAPGCYDAISARIIQDAGFPMAYMSGLCVAASMGYPDVGLISWTDIVKRAETIVNSISIPLLVDADSGYGGPANIAEAIRAFERAGVAGIHIEDQPFPKKCAALPGKSLISPALMQANIRTALDARRNADFVIVARTDAFAVNGLSDAIARASLYEAAGADATLIMSIASEQDMQQINAALNKPTLAMMLEKKRPLVNVKRLEEIGYAIVGYPLTLLEGQVAIQRQLATRMHAEGSSQSMLEAVASIDDINHILDLASINEVDLQSARYLAQATQA